MSSAFMGELLGTMTLILLGNGVVACVLLKGSFGEASGWMAITTGWGLAVISGVLVALAVGSNAHINPAVTIGVSVYSGDWSIAGLRNRPLGQQCGQIGQTGRGPVVAAPPDDAYGVEH